MSDNRNLRAVAPLSQGYSDTDWIACTLPESFDTLGTCRLQDTIAPVTFGGSMRGRE